MSQQIHRRHLGDTITVLPVTITQPNSSGVDTAVNLTGKTVKFKMLNRATGETKIAETATGVTVVTAASGIVNYDFSPTGVDEAGYFNGFFTVTDGAETDHFPVKQDDLRIEIDSDTQTAKEAYEAALEGA